VESSDKKWSTGERNGKPLQFPCCEMAKGYEQISLPGQKVFSTILGKSRGQLLTAPE